MSESIKYLILFMNYYFMSVLQEFIKDTFDLVPELLFHIPCIIWVYKGFDSVHELLFHVCIIIVYIGFDSVHELLLTINYLLYISCVCIVRVYKGFDSVPEAWRWIVWDPPTARRGGDSSDGSHSTHQTVQGWDHPARDCHTVSLAVLEIIWNSWNFPPNFA